MWTKPMIRIGLAIAVVVAIARAQETADSGPSVELTIAESIEQAKALVDLIEDASDRSSEEVQDAATDLGKLLTFVRAQDPLNVTAGYLSGRLSMLLDRPREALSPIEAYVNDPAGRNDWYAHKLLGDLYLVSYASQAKTRYSRAAELAPTEPEPRIGIAKSELKLVRAEEAISNAQAAIQLDKEQDPSFRVVLSEAYFLSRQYKEASDTAREAVALTEEQVRQNAGDRRLLEELKQRYELLVRCLSYLSDTFPKDPEFLIQIVQVIQDFADLERIISYHNAVELLEYRLGRFGDEIPVSVLYEQARLNRLIGRDEVAKETLDKLLAIEPSHAAAIQLRDAIEATTVGEPTARRDNSSNQ